MKIEIRLQRELYQKILTDLHRPHQHAFERIGFLSAIIGCLNADSMLIIFTKYFAVPDANYIDDSKVGARIDGTAIRSVMQRILDTKEGAFHVHIHSHLFDGCLNFSRTDLHDLPRMINSFKVVGPNLAHGAILFGEGKCTSLIWLPDHDKPFSASKLTIVGFPVDFV